MTRFILIPGAGGVGWYWQRVAERLRARGHGALPVDLPGNGRLPDYRDIVLAELREGDVVVAQSLGGFTAGAVCGVTRPAAVVFVNAMIPAPGETAGEWWANVGAEEARLAAVDGYPPEFTAETYFLHDVPPDIAAEGEPLQQEQTDAICGDPCVFGGWDDIAMRILVGADDRFFPADFQRRVALERTGVNPDVVPGGHLVALSNPDAVVDYLA
ncbi:alpha/beta hydrolase [Mycolicibacterium sp. XJ870]